MHGHDVWDYSHSYLADDPTQMSTLKFLMLTGMALLLGSAPNSSSQGAFCAQTSSVRAIPHDFGSFMGLHRDGSKGKVNMSLLCVKHVPQASRSYN